MSSFDLVFFGKKLPTTWLITLDSITSVAFLAGVAVFYRWYAKRRREPDEITKLIIGSAFSALGMLCLLMAAVSKPAGGKIGLLWPVAFHLTNSIAFAHILPVSLGFFAKSAPATINSTVLGLYYLAFLCATPSWAGSVACMPSGPHPGSGCFTSRSPSAPGWSLCSSRSSSGHTS
jgi:proton-dependent oligopeptide transporter, POT family